MLTAFDFGVITRNLPYLWEGMQLSLLLTGLSAAGSIVLGTILALMRLSGIALFQWIGAIWVNFFRSLPLLLVIFWFYFLVPVLVQRQVDAFQSALIGFVLDTDGLYDSMTAHENLEYYAYMYGQRPDARAIQELLADVGLGDRTAEPVGRFSRGMRQRAAVARALVHDPEVLILDEPMSGVDPPGQIELRAILRQLVDEKKKTILLSSHNLDEIQRLCNRIALIDEGELRLEGELKELLRQQGEGAIVVRTRQRPEPGMIEELGRQSGFGLSDSDADTLRFKPTADVSTPEIVSYLAGHGVEIEGVERAQGSLEQIYEEILREREQES